MSWDQGGGHRGGRARLGGILLAGLLLALAAGSSAAHPPRAASGWSVLSIDQTANVTATSTFTISMQVSDPSKVSFAFFTFCQLTSPVCYQPVVMTQQSGGSDWFAGTTKPMTNYSGMHPGVHAGYNITIQLTDNVNLTEPAVPNAFTNLTVTTSVSGEYMFEMSVRSLVFDLAGTVTDLASGNPLAGAQVSLSPGANSTVTSSTGAYSFSELFNGTYQVTVSYHGYTSKSTAVTISGKNQVANLALVNASSGGGGGGSGGNGGSGSGHSSSSTSLLSGSTPYLVLAVLVVIGLIVAVLTFRRYGS